MSAISPEIPSRRGAKPVPRFIYIAKLSASIGSRGRRGSIIHGTRLST